MKDVIIKAQFEVIFLNESIAHLQEMLLIYNWAINIYCNTLFNVFLYSVVQIYPIVLGKRCEYYQCFCSRCMNIYQIFRHLEFQLIFFAQVLSAQLLHTSNIRQR